jgi:hypothetical protein
VEVLGTHSGAFRKARATNANSSSFPSKIPTVTEPTGDGIIDIGGPDGGIGQNAARITPYGLGSDNDVFSLRVIAWNRIKASGVLDLWVPTVLVEVSCQCCGVVGIAGSAVLNTERFCDAITLVTGNDDVSVDIVSAGATAEVISHFVVALKGAQKIELAYDQTTGTPTTNALIALF